ncbi:MAG TPA: trigger factor [Chitinophagaceae bacterium]|nr:trigger factor [Chitinophagaceae bacterium]
MATVTREQIGTLHDKLVVTLSKNDYYPAFEKGLKQYAQKANIPGFRKGMVPAGLVKKMYGQSIFTDEILRTVEKELNAYLTNEKLDIFAQPLPLEGDAAKLDVNNPADYTFNFEIGLKPALNIDLNKGTYTRYKIEVTETMINEEVDRLRTRFGKMTEPEAINNDENVLNVTFTETDEAGNAVEGGISKASNSLLVKYFTEAQRAVLQGKKVGDSLTVKLNDALEATSKEAVLGDLNLRHEDADKYFTIAITKVGLVEKAELNNEFFEAAYPGAGIEHEAGFRNRVLQDIDAYFAQQTTNQLHDQIFHNLVDHTTVEFPEAFLKRWLQVGGEKPKTAEEAEAEYPGFAKQLKWSIVSGQLINDNKIEVNQDELRAFAKQQMLGYMNVPMSGEDMPWLDDYINRMMSDRKYVENTYFQLQTDKLFRYVETQINPTEQPISVEAFTDMVKNHHH